MNDMDFRRSMTGDRGLTGIGGMEPCMIGGRPCTGPDTGVDTRPCAGPGAGSGKRVGARPGCMRQDGAGQGTDTGTRQSGVRGGRPENGPDTRPGCGCGQGSGTPERGTRGCAVPAGQGGGQGGGCRPGCRHDLLDEIRAVEFSLCELTEYLDVYPDCREALMMYRELRGRRDELVGRYEREVGPLTCLGNVSCTSWDWVRGPFPWAYEAND